MPDSGQTLSFDEAALFGRHVEIDASTRAMILRLLQKLQDPQLKLPILPAKAQQALDIATRTDASLRELQQVIEADPLIAARVLAVGNSALYGSRSPATSLRSAVARLGGDALRSILMSVVLEAHALGGRADIRLETLRRHSLLVAHSARRLCQMLGMDDELAFMCGLFHDVGQSVLLKLLSKAPREDSMGYHEHDLIDVLHGVAGERLLMTWRLPAPAIEAAMRHHNYGERNSSAGYYPLSNAVALVDRLAYSIGVGEWPMDNETAALDAAEDLGITDVQLDSLRTWMTETAKKLDS